MSQAVNNAGVGFLRASESDPSPGFRERNSRRGRNTAKTCRHCGETKRAAEFRRNERTRDGLSSWCAACHNEASRRWREKRRELVAEALEARRRKSSLRDQARRQCGHRRMSGLGPRAAA